MKTLKQLKKEFIIDIPLTSLEGKLERLIEKGVRIIVSKEKRPYIDFIKPYTHKKKELEKEAYEIYEIICKS